MFSSTQDIATCLHGDRQDANTKLWELIMKGDRSTFENTFVEYLKEEIFHVQFVRMIMKELTGMDNNHDWSKDYYYMAVTILGFKMDSKDLVKDLLEKEIEFHYELEAHHIEHMDYSKRLMTDREIREMAVDRLSRNLQFNNGEINLDQMIQFEPKFRHCPVADCQDDTHPTTMCQHEKHLINRYKNFVEEYKDIVTDQWMY